MTTRRVRTAAICGWAVLALTLPGIAYIVGGLVLLILLIGHLAQQVDTGEVDTDPGLTLDWGWPGRAGGIAEGMTAADEQAWLASLADWHPSTDQDHWQP
ncbi:MAG: hypothetical protein QM286_01275 [Acidobacteriota bacterium]|nr:hypothetical protein [Acidobacteriota bacterium]